MATPTKEKQFIQALRDLKTQATTTRMSDRRHLKTFVALVFEHRADAMKPAVTVRLRRYVREFQWA